jgi:hypothetical protein
MNGFRRPPLRRGGAEPSGAAGDIQQAGPAPGLHRVQHGVIDLRSDRGGGVIIAFRHPRVAGALELLECLGIDGRLLRHFRPPLQPVSPSEDTRVTAAPKALLQGFRIRRIRVGNAEAKDGGELERQPAIVV